MLCMFAGRPRASCWAQMMPSASCLTLCGVLCGWQLHSAGPCRRTHGIGQRYPHTQVRDNQASRSAYRLARQLIKLPGDVLILVHIVSALAAPKEGEALLASFTSAMTDAQTKRRVVQQVGAGGCKLGSLLALHPWYWPKIPMYS
eukprot:1157790-Pelagomonas_calceolata.AAC.3